MFSHSGPTWCCWCWCVYIIASWLDKDKNIIINNESYGSLDVSKGGSSYFTATLKIISLDVLDVCGFAKDLKKKFRKVFSRWLLKVFSTLLHEIFHQKFKVKETIKWNWELTSEFWYIDTRLMDTGLQNHFFTSWKCLSTSYQTFVREILDMQMRNIPQTLITFINNLHLHQILNLHNEYNIFKVEVTIF